MKSLFACLPLLLLAAFTYGQARPTTVKFNKNTHPALLLQVPYSETIAKGAIIQKLKEIGYTPQTSSSLLFIKKNMVDGYYVFRKVLLEGQPVDLYFKVDQVGKKDRNESNIYLMVSDGPTTFISGESNSRTYDAAAGFLNDMTSYSASYKMDVDITGQENTVKEAEKKLQKLKEEEQQLTEKLNNIKQQQGNQSKLLESEKAKLETLRGKKAAKS